MINFTYKSSILKHLHIDFLMLLNIIFLIIYGIVIMWSASGQNISIMQNRFLQIIIGFTIMFIMAQIPPKIYENGALYLYICCILSLLCVIFFGQISKGAQRWLNIGFIHFQPSEFAKIAVPLMVARFINRNLCPPTIINTIFALILIIIPVILVAIQPDLGTAILIAISGIFILFLSGMNWKLIIFIIINILCFLPILWFFLMHDYQRDRIKMLLAPEIDPLGAGYHIIQSKIAIGSGGLFGKGWLQGTQSQLEFLPERNTDFIFAVLAEEMGLIGILVLLILYILLIIRGFVIAIYAQNTFGRVIVSGLMLILFIYIFINISMVSGILPVVGVPLPLISYGGSSLIVLMSGFGIIMSIHTHRKLLSKNL